jgi:3-hydroxybutyrate dehydrogenase
MSHHMFKGKTALVTGSTSGIGLGIARALVAEAANLVINGFGNVMEIEQLRIQHAATYGVKVFHSPADMSKAASVQTMMNLATHEFGVVDMLVNNAGIQFVAPVDVFPIDKWDAIIAIIECVECRAARSADAPPVCSYPDCDGARLDANIGLGGGVMRRRRAV